MTFAKLQRGLCECIDRHVLKSVNRILYRMPVQLFAEAIYFDTMAVVDEASMRQMMQCYQQTQMHVPAMELFVDFDRLSEVKEDPEIDNEKQTVLQENLTDSKDELEATYDVDDEDEDDEEGRAIVALQALHKCVSDHLAPAHCRGVPCNHYSIRRRRCLCGR
ncbi:hypothetical protein PIB30_036538 [Stylosanthes scabra]|uniref:Uncharacterized protein n=1 Tax=Stylosanthes scabra TaxID=79078 RepID=A0ABU6TDN9_9FABA|nr:hypothetical protein [Stylosanthes scabra]